MSGKLYCKAMLEASTKDASGDSIYTFRVTSEVIDRQGEIVTADGWNMENYLLNPVVLDSHQYNGIEHIVGRCLSLNRTDRGWEADIKFNQTERGRLAEMLVAGGDLRAVSVGFRSIKVDFPDFPSPRQARGIVDMSTPPERAVKHVEKELLEISVVPIPANAEALRTRSATVRQDATDVVTKFVAPGWMRDNVQRGIAWYEDGRAGDGVTAQTIREARAMAAGNVSDGKAVRMAAWFARHMVDLDAPAAQPDSDDYPSAGVVAHALWGGGTRQQSQRAWDWAKARVAEMDDGATAGEERTVAAATTDGMEVLKGANVTIVISEEAEVEVGEEEGGEGAAGRICPQCGAECDAEDSYCPECGAALNAPVAPATVTEAYTCRNCGDRVRPGAKFCGKCGMSTISGRAADDDHAKAVATITADTLDEALDVVEATLVAEADDQKHGKHPHPDHTDPHDQKDAAVETKAVTCPSSGKECTAGCMRYCTLTGEEVATEDKTEDGKTTGDKKSVEATLESLIDLLRQNGVARSVVERSDAAITRTVPRPHDTPMAPETQAWDGPRQVAAATTDDLRVMCAWYDETAPDVKSSYKLPHHEADAPHQVVWRGVAAAMGIVFGARGGVDVPDEDRQAIYDHLAAHYRQFDKVPPEFRSLTDSELASMGVYSSQPESITGRSVDGDEESGISPTLAQVVWPLTASAMYAVLNDVTTPDDTRKRVYVGLQRLYGVLDQVAPDFVPRKTVAKLTEDQRDGMFWSGEDRIATKAGRALSTVNETRLRQAIDLIGLVLQSNAPTPPDEPPVETQSDNRTLGVEASQDAVLAPALDVDVSALAAFLSRHEPKE